MAEQIRPSLVFKKPAEWLLSDGSQFCTCYTSKIHNEWPLHMIKQVICKCPGCQYVHFPCCCLSVNTRPWETVFCENYELMKAEVVWSKCLWIFGARSFGIFRDRNIFRNIFWLFCSEGQNSRNGNPGIPEREYLPNKRLLALLQLFLFRIDPKRTHPKLSLKFVS